MAPREATLSAAQLAQQSGRAPAEIDKLDLSGLGLEDISEVACCHALVALRVDNNKLADFAGLEELPELATLSAQNNVLTSLDGLRGVPKLWNLNVSSNQLTSLGTTLREAVGLKVLLATDNALKRLDLHLFKRLEQLTTIVASRNRITEVNGADKLAQLRKLSLSHNELRTLGALPTTLVELRLSHNLLAALPAALGACARLTLLDLGSNQLRSLDQLAPLRDLERLSNLTLRGNPLCDVLGAAYRIKTKQALSRVRLLDNVELTLHGGALGANRKVRFDEDAAADAKPAEAAPARPPSAAAGRADAAPAKAAPAKDVRAKEAPAKRAETAPAQRAETAPAKRADAAPPKRAEAAPVAATAPAAVKAAPAKRAEAAPNKGAGAAPVKRVEAAPAKRAEAAPVKRAAETAPAKRAAAAPSQAMGKPRKAEARARDGPAADEPLKRDGAAACAADVPAKAKPAAAQQPARGASGESDAAAAEHAHADADALTAGGTKRKRKSRTPADASAAGNNDDEAEPSAIHPRERAAAKRRAAQVAEMGGEVDTGIVGVEDIRSKSGGAANGVTLADLEQLAMASTAGFESW